MCHVCVMSPHGAGRPSWGAPVYHSERKRKRAELLASEGVSTVSAEEVQAALTEALQAEMTAG
mgnify:CR=1 FL=1